MRIFLIIAAGFFALNLSAQPVKWYSWEEAIRLNKEEPRKIMVDVYTDWCGYCKVMDRTTFSNEVIASYLNDVYYPVKLDAEGKDSIIYNKYTYKFIPSGNKGVHELAYALLNGELSYPSIVFLNEEVQIIHIQKGYVEPIPFDEIMKYIGGGFYETTPWNDWKKDYTSPL
ncbi:MAG: DUF255 domain-containing protein [Bacteroidales bacterium]|nr:DUF255 domain-containing protein [Bacteroidales bacterium]